MEHHKFFSFEIFVMVPLGCQGTYVFMEPLTPLACFGNSPKFDI